MSRLLDGTDDQIVDEIGSNTLDVTGALTFLALIKMGANGTWASFIETELVAGNNRMSMLRDTGNSLRFANSLGFADAAPTPTYQTGDGWVLVAATKATGTAEPSGHKMPIGGSRTTTAMGESIASDTAAGRVRLGGNDDFASMRIGAAAIFDKVLTTGELDVILTAKTSQSIVDLAPIWFADDGDSFANEYVSDRALTVGGTDDADDPAGWIYLGQSAAPVDYDYSRFPKPKLRELANR